VPAATVRDLCLKYPTLRATILEQVTTRLREAHEKLRSVALERVEQRLARMLLTLAEKIGQAEKGIVRLSVTRQELADMIGTTVETTIRITTKWQSQGIISSSRHEISLDNPSDFASSPFRVSSHRRTARQNRHSTQDAPPRRSWCLPKRG